MQKYVDIGVTSRDTNFGFDDIKERLSQAGIELEGGYENSPEKLIYEGDSFELEFRPTTIIRRDYEQSYSTTADIYVLSVADELTENDFKDSEIMKV